MVLISKSNCNYFYNYDGAENDGYYWSDNYDYGEKITYVPQNPEREGYIFGGWYKEPECVNEWDFTKDTLPAAEYDEDGNRRIVEEDDDRDVEDDDDNTNDETFYGSYTPEADIKDVDEDLADD